VVLNSRPTRAGEVVLKEIRRPPDLGSTPLANRGRRSPIGFSRANAAEKSQLGPGDRAAPPTAPALAKSVAVWP